MVFHKKICLIKRSLAPFGGLEKYTEYLSSHFSKLGCEVSFLAANPYGDRPTQVVKPKGILSYQKLKDFDAKATKWLQTQDFDVIFGMDRTTYLTHIRAGNGCHAAYMKQREMVDPKYKRLFAPLNPLNKATLALEKKAFECNNLQKLFVNSHMVKEEILEYYDTPEDKIAVIHNGVEYEALQNSFNNWRYDKERLIEEYNLPKDQSYLLFIGNGYLRKGLLFVMQALAKTHGDLHLIVVGKEKKIAFFKSLAKQLGIAKRVSFLGYQKKASSLLAIADTVIIPSLYDPFANVTVEALAYGCFVITSPYNGGKEVLTKQNGYVIEDLFDEEEIINALQIACKRKTVDSALSIRKSVKHLNFSKQLGKISSLCLQ